MGERKKERKREREKENNNNMLIKFLVFLFP
jgi:hypothetical protein